MSKPISTETVTSIHLTSLHPFPDHPFFIKDDAATDSMVESIKSGGILTPILVRPREGGDYEIVSGHRRRRACELAGVDTIPAILREMTREEAIITMVDSNLQREEILPSERAQAYKMKLEALKRQGERTDLTCGQVGHKLTGTKSRDIVAEDTGESARSVQRYIRLTELAPQLQQMVDEKRIGLTPAVEISYLNPEEQQLLIDTMDSEQTTPSLSQAQRMKKLSKEGKLTDDTMLEIMMEQKKPVKKDVTLTEELLSRYFPKNYTALQVQNTIVKLLDAWQKKRQQSRAETR